MTFENFVKQGLYLRAWSKKTVRTYRQAWSSFQASLGQSQDCPAPDGLRLSKASLETWVIRLREKGLSPGGCNMYIRTMNSYLSWLHQEHEQPALRIKLLPDPRKPLRGFSDAELRLLLSFRPKGFFQLRTWTLISLLLDTGVRIDEALTLRPEKVNLDDLHLTVVGKGNKERVVPFSLQFRKTLFRYTQEVIKRGVRSQFVFGTDGGHLSYRNSYRDIKKLCKKAGVEGEHVHPHAFRHCFAVNYIRKGGDLYRLSRCLGHSQISTTAIYLRSMGVEQVREGHHSPLES